MKKLFLIFAASLFASFTIVAKSYKVQAFVSENGYSFVQFEEIECPYRIKCDDYYYPNYGCLYEIKTALNLYGWNSKTGTWDSFGKLELNNTDVDIKSYANVFGNSKAAVIETTDKDFEISLASRTVSVQKTKEARKATAEAKDTEARNAKNSQRIERFQKYKIVDAELKGKSKGYVYHGISETTTTEKLLEAKALSSGNAYVSGHL